MIQGPKNPPRFPSELISPIEAAAADSLRNVVGTAQNAGWKEKYPAQTRLNRQTVSTTFVPNNTARSKLTPLENIGIAACHRRSQDLSECQAFNCCAKKPATYGNETIRVTRRSLCPDRRFRIVGNQKAMP